MCTGQRAACQLPKQRQQHRVQQLSSRQQQFPQANLPRHSHCTPSRNILLNLPRHNLWNLPRHNL